MNLLGQFLGLDKAISKDLVVILQGLTGLIPRT